MHEMALCRNVVDIVLEEAKKARTPEVRSVGVTVGEVRDIVDDIFCDMFDWLARGTVAEHAKVTITRVPLIVTCQECGHEYHLDVHDQSTWPCPECGKRNYKLKTGMEFYISNIEVARPAPSAEDLEALTARVAQMNRAEAAQEASA